MGERTGGEVGDIKVRAEVETGFTRVNPVKEELEAARLLERDRVLCITLAQVLATMEK